MNEESLVYKNIIIRVREDNLINLSDLWKAEGKIRTKRPGDWVKQTSTQNKLKETAIGTGATYKLSFDGDMLYIAGILEVVKGGKPGFQGTFGDRQNAIEYADFLSEECGRWVRDNFSEQVVLDSLSPEVVFSLMKSDKEFPIDFDDAWKWIGYSRKDKGKPNLISNFEKNIDYIQQMTFPKKGKTSSGGASSQKYYLTVDCFKSYCLMAGTERGKKVRKYFIECEKTLQEILLKKQQQWKTCGIELIVSEGYTAWKKRFEDEFFEEAYRVMGWKRTKSGHPSCMGWFINKAVYEFFPDGTLDKLREVNPKINGNRRRKHHQHLKDPGLKGLDHQKGAVLATLRLSPTGNPEKFMRNLVIALGLPLVDDCIV